MSRDLSGILRGMQIVAEALAKHQTSHAKQFWANSSIRRGLEEGVTALQSKANSVLKDPGKELENVGNALKEALERSSTVTSGIREFASTPAASSEETGPTSSPGSDGKINLANLDVSSVTLTELEQILSEIKQKKVRLRYEEDQRKLKSERVAAVPPEPSVQRAPEAVKGTEQVKNILDVVANYRKDEAVQVPIELPELSDVAKQRKVPSSRIGRVISFGNLFAGLGLGTVTGLTKGALGMEGGAATMKEAVLSPDNMERIVDTLCKVRGAALKLGQILSKFHHFPQNHLK